MAGKCTDVRVAKNTVRLDRRWWRHIAWRYKRGRDYTVSVNVWSHQGMSLYVLAAGEQLATDVAAEGAHARVDDQVPLERAPVLGDVVTVGALELIEG